MKKRRAALTDSERLLVGSVPEDEGLSRLRPHIEALRQVGRRVPTEAEVHQFAAAAANMASSRRHGSAGDTRLGSPSHPRRSSLTPRLAGAAAALILLLSTTAGVAYAADRAIPGDALYSLDRALEDIGLGDHGLQERLTEAGELVARGRTQEGLALAGQAIAAQSTQDDALYRAASALRVAADAAGDDPSTQTPEAQALASERLRWLATMDPTGDQFVRAIYDLAEEILPQGQGAPGGPNDAFDRPAPDGGSDDSGGGQGDTGPAGNAGGNGPRD